MNRLLLVGFGDIASRIVALCAQSPSKAKQTAELSLRTCQLTCQPTCQPSHLRLGAVIRSAERFQSAHATTPELIRFRADLADADSLHRALAWCDAVIHLAPPPNQGTIDTHTKHLIAAIGHRKASQRQRRHLRLPAKPLPLTYVSTTGVYGDHAGALVNETSRALHPSPRGVRRINAEQQLRAAVRTGLISLNILRAPGIYSVPDRLPLERLHQGVPALIPEDDVSTNHIHADDLARLCLVSAIRLTRPCYANKSFNSIGNARAYNAVDWTDLKMGDYFDLVADHFRLTRPPRLSRADLSEQVSSARLSFMSESRRLRPDRLAREWRFQWRYPSVQEALNAALESSS